MREFDLGMRTDDVNTASVPQPQDKNPPPRTRLSVAVAALLLVVVVVLAFAEVAVRVAGLGRKPRDVFADATLGFAVPKNLLDKGYLPEHPLKVFDYPYNNHGFMEWENTAQTPVSGVHRIAVLGDSHTQCLCPPQESFTNQLEAMLNGIAGGTRFEALNAGAGRYSPYQYYVKTENIVAPLNPELLVVGLYIGNDLADLTRQDDRPYLEIQPDGSFAAREPIFIVHQDPNASSVLENSRLYNLVAHAVGSTIGYQVTRAKLLVHNVSKAGYGWSDAFKYMVSVKKLTDVSRGMMTQMLHQYHWFDFFPETREPALRQNREVMRRFKELAAAKGIGLVYVLIPTKADIEPEDMQEKWAAIAAYDPAITRERLVEFNSMYIEETKKAGADLGVPVVDLRPGLLSQKKPGIRLFYKEDMHLNPDGHRAVAEILTETLRGRFRETAAANSAQ